MEIKVAFFLGVLTVLGFTAVIQSAPVDSVHILRYENMQAEDRYSFNFLTSDGQKREETGMLVNGGQELVVHGAYSYTGPDNRLYLVEYVADRNGFRPKIMIVVADKAEEDLPVRFAGGVPDSGIRPDLLKSLLG